jgi:hypothetical protein
LESIYSAFGVDKLLATGEERVAARANLDAQVALMRGAGFKDGTAGADYFYFVVSRMDPGFHGSLESFAFSLALSGKAPAGRLMRPARALLLLL